MNRLLKILPYFFSDIIVRLNGGILSVNRKLNRLEKGLRKELLSTAYFQELKKNGSWIGYNAHFEGMPVFPHGISGIFISDGAKVGSNCVIFQQVTIGSNTLPNSKGAGAPVIGDNCYIGAGAKIIGNVKIGNNCRIGANCVVFKDMPDNSVAVLQPPQIIQKSSLDNRFL